MKNEGNKHNDIAFWIVLVLAAVLYLAFLELNKNMLFGWGLTALLITGFVTQRRKTRYRGIPLRLGTWAGFFLLLWVIGMISWPPVRTVPATDHISGCTEPVQTQYGPVSGVISEEKGIEVYAGIPYAVVKKMAGGFLIIEGAGELAADTVDKLNRAMEFRTDDMVVILEDEKQDMKALLDMYPEFAAKFTSRITIPVFTNDELVTFGKTYAQENGYSFDEMATLALYTMIGENQKDSEPVTVGMVRDMIDKAISRSRSKKFPLFGKNQVGADGRIILREKDFAF